LSFPLRHRGLILIVVVAKPTREAALDLLQLRAQNYIGGSTAARAGPGEHRAPDVGFVRHRQAAAMS